MSVDKRVPGRSDEEVRRIAERTKTEFAVSRRRPVNILRCLESGSVATCYGRKKLLFLVVDDEELPGADAKTEFRKDAVVITTKRSVRHDAELGVGRARMTLAHELAHAVLHHSVPLFRLVGASGATELAKVTAYESAEHQAKVFAAAFLIHDEDAAQMKDAAEISVEFGVSLQAAEVCFERFRVKAEHTRSAQRVRKIADEAIAALTRKTKYLDQVCTICRQRKLVSFGNKVRCENCKYTGDQFPDGDKLD